MEAANYIIGQCTMELLPYGEIGSWSLAKVYWICLLESKLFRSPLIGFQNWKLGGT